MATIPWRVAPITTLTVRQFFGAKTTRVVLVIGLLPVLFALIYLLSAPDIPARVFAITLFRQLIVPTILPIATLLLATSAFGNELEDRTLPYLTLKPVSRLRITLEKWVASLLAAPLLAIGLLVFLAVASRGPEEPASRLSSGLPFWTIAWPMIASMSAGVVLLSALFLLISLFAQRALLVGMIYVFVWESLLGRFLPGVEVASTRHQVESIFVHMLNDRTVTLTDANSLSGALTAIAIITVICLGLAATRLRRMNLE